MGCFFTSGDSLESNIYEFSNTSLHFGSLATKKKVLLVNRIIRILGRERTTYDDQQTQAPLPPAENVCSHMDKVVLLILKITESRCER